MLVAKFFKITICDIKTGSTQNIHPTPSRSKRMLKIDTNNNQQQTIGSTAIRKSVI
jgi:hypothetical protein